jgi:hypothetical protein
MRRRWAVIAQGVIFGLSHYFEGPYSVALTTVTGVLFGLPRLFGVGIVPMILAHSLLNLILGAPFFLSLPENWPLARSTRCQEIEALKSEPMEKALPIVIEALGSDDDQAIVCASMVLKHRYAAVAMSALGEALRSDRHATVFGAVFAWRELRYPELVPDVRRIAEDTADRGFRHVRFGLSLKTATTNGYDRGRTVHQTHERAAWRGRHSANSRRRRWKRRVSRMHRRDAPPRRGWRCGVARPFSIPALAARGPSCFLRQQAVECRGERMAGRLRQVRGHDEGPQLPFPTRLPECHAPSWAGLGSSRSRLQQFGVLCPGTEGTWATAC